jgi:hypothetical protein
MYNFFNEPCRYLGALLPDGATALGQIQWLARPYKFLIFPPQTFLEGFSRVSRPVRRIAPFFARNTGT